MRFSNIIAGASLASMAVAAPLEKRVYATDWVVEVVTMTTTVYPGAQATPAPAPAPAPAAPVPGAFLQQPAPEAPKKQQPKPKPKPAPAPAPVQAAPQPAYTPPASSGSDGWKNVNPDSCLSGASAQAAASGDSPSSCGVSWLDTLNAARQGYGKSRLSWDQKLADFSGNVVNTNPFHHNDLGGGVSMGEIMAGGGLTSDGNLHGTTPFGVAIAMWLCEIPNSDHLSAGGFSGINLCQAFGFGRGGTTLHNEILLGNHSKVGCMHGSAGYVCNFS